MQGQESGRLQGSRVNDPRRKCTEPKHSYGNGCMLAGKFGQAIKTSDPGQRPPKWWKNRDVRGRSQGVATLEALGELLFERGELRVKRRWW